MPRSSNKQNKNTSLIISRQDYQLTQSCPSEKSKKKKKHLSINLTLYEAYANHCTNLRGAETNGRKNAVLKTEKRRPQTQYILKNNEKAKKYYTNEGTN